MVVAVLAHIPGHLRGAGSHVGSGNVAIGADQIVHHIHEAAGDPLKLAAAVGPRVNGDAPLGAAVGNVDDSRLPGHQRSERPHLVEIDLRVIPQPSLHRAAGVVVLHPVADECGHLSGVELDRNLHLHLPLRGEQQAATVF